MRHQPVIALVVAIVASGLVLPARAAVPQLPPPALSATELGLIINADDPLSVQVGDYYRQRRSIPPQNVVRIHMPRTPVLSVEEFARVKREIDMLLPASVQALALAWTLPFRVSCMSATSAFAYGFSEANCADGCRLTPSIPYFDSDSHRPYVDFRVRPAMLLAARDFDQARRLIDRGIASDGTAPRGTAYLMETSDKARNARQPSFTSALALRRPGVDIQIIKADVLRDRPDVLFYFTGLITVEAIGSNHFVPGAMADHLTSAGGVLPDSYQMSSLKWLDAGATGSYGTVVEPCAFTSKFPSVPIAMRHYLAGDTLLEAYWKSVLMPSQGVFIGEPLAAPFRTISRGVEAPHEITRSRSERN